MPGRGRPFERGQSGNLSGRPKLDQTITELARAHGPQAIAMLARLMNDAKVGASTRVTAAAQLLDRAYGRAPSFSTTDVGDFRRAVELSDDELARIALAAGIQIEPRATPAETAPPNVGRDVGKSDDPWSKPN